MCKFRGNLLVVVALCCGSVGCADMNRSGRGGLWPFGGQKSDIVPGVISPAERISVLRKMGEKASWAEPAEQERISAELAAAFPNEADPLIRIEIIRALAEYGTTTAESMLAAALDDSDADVRLAACQAWGSRGGSAATANLSRVIGSDVDTDVRLAAIQALGEVGDSTSVAVLGEALEDRDPAMQYAAVQSLREVTEEDFGNDVVRWRQYVKGEPPSPAESISIAERFRRLF
ncbi:MAG: HEAT repeat domain-containing protein [Planctomycetes bacterium]|nr:HEAT repeat domain-containing protein [Planctomycetota bacterium]